MSPQNEERKEKNPHPQDPRRTPQQDKKTPNSRSTKSPHTPTLPKEPQPPTKQRHPPKELLAQVRDTQLRKPKRRSKHRSNTTPSLPNDAPKVIAMTQKYPN